ncbi:MAG: NDP-sugar synthase, partial [Bacteroidaceae bacterium]|nr:NDP-sugar synthase [Bacteroidaceae bacterium]
ITAFCDSPTARSKYISGGIYGLTPQALDILDECIAAGNSRMRNFQRKLVEGGMKLKAYPFGKIIDIDHAGDIEKAEEFLAE